MKRIVAVIFLSVLIFYGLSFLLFVLKMMWFPPTMMGMMMGRYMMYQQMIGWFYQTFWFSLIIAGVILFIWAIRESRKKS